MIENPSFRVTHHPLQQFLRQGVLDAHILCLVVVRNVYHERGGLVIIDVHLASLELGSKEMSVHCEAEP